MVEVKGDNISLVPCIKIICNTNHVEVCLFECNMAEGCIGTFSFHLYVVYNQIR